MESIVLKIKRQDDPEGLPYWEKFEVPYEPGLTVALALSKAGLQHAEMALSTQAGEKVMTAEGYPTSPPSCELSCMEGVCGACAMTINGKIRLACRTYVDDLSGPVRLEPLPKFPIVRDLIVDRSSMSDSLERFRCWNLLDGLHDTGDPKPGPFESRFEKQEAYSGCVMCGLCVVACPQVNERSEFTGAFVFAHALMLDLGNGCPSSEDQRLDAMLEKGGVSDCGGAGVCEEVCPAGIPLASVMSRVGGMAGRFSLRNFFLGDK